MMNRYLIALCLHSFVIFHLLMGSFVIMGGHINIFINAAPIYALTMIFIVGYFIAFRKVEVDDSGKWTEQGFKDIRSSIAKIGLIVGITSLLLGLIKSAGHVEGPTDVLAGNFASSIVPVVLGLVFFIAAYITVSPSKNSNWELADSTTNLKNGYVSFCVVATTIIILSAAGMLIHDVFIKEKTPTYTYDAWDSANDQPGVSVPLYLIINCLPYLVGSLV